MSVGHRRDKSRFTTVGSKDSVTGGPEETENHALGHIRRPQHVATGPYIDPRW